MKQRTVAEDIVQRQRTSNRKSAGRWDEYATHRAHLTTLVTSFGGDDCALDLAIVGAGNGNDLDLGWMLARFRHVHLVDLDGEALARSLRQVSAADRGRVSLHERVDVTKKLTASWLPCDVVVSDCVLTQAARLAADGLGLSGDAAVAYKRQLASDHVDALTRMTAAGGHAVLVTDVVSSDYVALDEAETASLEPLLDELARAGNVFPSADPRLIRTQLRRQERQGCVRDVRAHAPWLWTALEDRTYLVTAWSWCATPASSAADETS